MFDRRIYFDGVRQIFGGRLTKGQVDGQNIILDGWENIKPDADRRKLGYMLATTFWETARTMYPIEEIGKGAGKEYGKPHPATGHVYYGRGYVQLTWYDNYLLAEDKLNIPFTIKPDLALMPGHAFNIMYLGMHEGWFRKGHNLERYFNLTTDDPFNAREIINGDKNIKPDWAKGENIGSMVKDAYMTFTAALNASYYVGEDLEPAPVPDLVVKVIVPKGVRVELVQEEEPPPKQ